MHTLFFRIHSIPIIIGELAIIELRCIKSMALQRCVTNDLSVNNGPSRFIFLISLCRDMVGSRMRKLK